MLLVIKSIQHLLNVFLFLVLVLVPIKTFAQPYLSTRFAQNCAACHAPGRFNRPLSERHCTLSCQGCHVNPNGGGIRSSYGNWVKERWLRSFIVPGLRTNKASPAPFEMQEYGKSVPTKASVKEKRPGLMTVTDPSPSEALYDRSHEKNGKIEVGEAAYESQIPTGDPYWLEKLMPVTAGADLRYFIIDRTEGSFADGKTFKAFPMSADIGVRVKPIENHLSLVAEARFLNGPLKSQLEKFFTEEARVRSAYVLTDQWPFNTFVMAGLYRPLFGYYTPDHTTLSQTISGLGARSRFLAISAGTAPNVPFLNLHLIQPQTGDVDIRGFAANIGARFVTMGASFMLSYWNTKTKVGGVDLGKNMISATSGLQIWRTTLNVEYLRVNQEFAPGSSDTGNVYTIDTQSRIWRQIYLVASGAYSDVNRSLLAGKCYEYMLGFKSYFISGAETELLYIHRKNESRGASTLTTDIQLQFHLFI